MSNRKRGTTRKQKLIKKGECHFNRDTANTDINAEVTPTTLSTSNRVAWESSGIQLEVES